jgi:hypothetical protein
MPYIAYITFSILLIILLSLMWISNRMGEDAITILVSMAMGSVLTIIILAKCGVDLR